MIDSLGVVEWVCIRFHYSNGVSLNFVSCVYGGFFHLVFLDIWLYETGVME